MQRPCGQKLKEKEERDPTSRCCDQSHKPGDQTGWSTIVLFEPFTRFLLCRLMPNTTSCCQDTAPAREEKRSANLFYGWRKPLWSCRSWGESWKLGAVQAEFTDKTKSPSCVLPHRSKAFASPQHLIWSGCSLREQQSREVVQTQQFWTPNCLHPRGKSHFVLFYKTYRTQQARNTSKCIH